MAISKNTQNKYNKANAAYKENNDIANTRNNLVSMAGKAPAYQNSYADQLRDIYGQIKNGKTFDYDPKNDVAFRKFADEYNALSGLAIAGNQNQAQNLTGGYGSTYAPEVANQGLSSMKANADNAQPYFMLGAQEAYKVNNDRLNDMYSAAADAHNDELNQYVNRVSAYNDMYSTAAGKYSDERNFGYDKYKDNRNFWADQYQFEQNTDNFNKELVQKDRQNKRDYTLQSYSVYEQLAEEKASKYKNNKDNKGMKSYLNGLVKDGKITQYMADTIYDNYKYTASKTGSGGGRSSGGKSSGRIDVGIADVNKNGKITVVDNMGKVVGTYDSPSEKDYTVKTGMLQQVGMNRSNPGRVNAIDKLEIDDDLKEWIASYFKV
ncbi:MAG: hypothetical protein NC213_09910 [Acetobacter sp.]|nr:hypothetical protein [Bacteroides sp.]MCM1342047.1 hypothetical protein [Acetobacter sp.]MCM1434267.1 hypothetical protein [Clostridiales bacterium]